MSAATVTPAPSVRRLPVLCVASLCWAFSFGLGAPLASLWLKHGGFSDTLVGLNTSIYYLGIALASPLVPWMLRRWGNRCAVAGMIASGVTVALFPWGGCLFGWHLLRFLNGVGGAMSLVALETQVNHSAPPDKRARNFGFYAFAIALGWALGTQVGMEMVGTAAWLAFLQGGLLAVAAALVVVGWLPEWHAPAEERHQRTPLQPLRNFLSFGSAWSQGFLEGGMMALLSIYLTVEIGFGDNTAGWLMSGSMLAVILSQVPIAWLADRCGRTAILVGCYLVALLGMFLLPWGSSFCWLLACLFLIGACSGAFYPLGLAILGERTPPSGLARANAWFLTINCLGSISGPLLTGQVADVLGRGAMFTVGEVALAGVVGFWAVLQLGRWLKKKQTETVAPESPETPDVLPLFKGSAALTEGPAVEKREAA